MPIHMLMCVDTLDYTFEQSLDLVLLQLQTGGQKVEGRGHRAAGSQQCLPAVGALCRVKSPFCGRTSGATQEFRQSGSPHSWLCHCLLPAGVHGMSMTVDHAFRMLSDFGSSSASSALVKGGTCIWVINRVLQAV